jgi:hypothetical protein
MGRIARRLAALFGPPVVWNHQRHKTFLCHSAEVKATIAPERLLVYEVGSGWEPLCEFFGFRVPSEAHPSENTRAEFQARVATANAQAS